MLLVNGAVCDSGLRLLGRYLSFSLGPFIAGDEIKVASPAKGALMKVSSLSAQEAARKKPGPAATH
jgi:hypothetical protein